MSGLSDSKIASGLKEALKVGADNTVKLTGQRDGYFGNEAIKILMPNSLRPVEKGLRAVGYGPKVDGFDLSMNRAAEAAACAPQASRKLVKENQPCGKADLIRAESASNNISIRRQQSLPRAVRRRARQREWYVLPGNNASKSMRLQQVR